jgi:transcriptional regulator with XRE-family HTH domain
MVKCAVKIPDDAVLARMSHAELSTLANELAVCCTPNDSSPLEWLSDALLRIHRGWRDGAHSETSDTRRRRKIIGKEIPAGDQANYIKAPISNDVIITMLRKAAAAGLSDWQQDVWLLADVIGWTQRAIAREFNVGQPAVSRALGRARQALWEHIDKHGNAFKVFILESRRTAYFRPAYRPPLPPELDEARREIEADTPISTHIQIDKPKQVEVWRRGVRPTRIREGREHSISHSFREIVAQAKKLKKERAQCNTFSKN